MGLAEEKTEKMKASSQALDGDKMIDSGVLTDYANNSKDLIGRELELVSIKESVEEELEECINKDLSSFNYFSHFTKSIANKSLISSKFDSKSHPYNSLNTLYIIFRVFRL